MKQTITFFIYVFLMFVFIWQVESESPFRSEVVVTSPYHATTGKGGERRNKLHEGIDIWCEDPIIFPALDGEVVRADYDNVFGYYVIIQHTRPAIGINEFENNWKIDKRYSYTDVFYSLYAHGSKIYYSASGMVTTETPIMKMGSSGYSGGPHLHFANFRVIGGKRFYFDPGEIING